MARTLVIDGTGAGDYINFKAYEIAGYQADDVLQVTDKAVIDDSEYEINIVGDLTNNITII